MVLNWGGGGSSFRNELGLAKVSCHTLHILQPDSTTKRRCRLLVRPLKLQHTERLIWNLCLFGMICPALIRSIKFSRMTFPCPGPPLISHHIIGLLSWLQYCPNTIQIFTGDQKTVLVGSGAGISSGELQIEGSLSTVTI